MQPRRLLLLAALAPLALPAAAAQAAAPDTAPLREAGWRVVWTTHGERAPLRAGSVVRVVVSPIRGRAPRRGGVRVALVRLGADGRPLRTVASRKVRRGTFRVRLPRGDGARYVLSVRAGRRTLRERLATAPRVAPPRASPRRVPRTSPPPPPAPPAPPGKPFMRCAAAPDARMSATLAVDRPSATAGDRLTVTTVNDGQVCLAGGWGVSWERLADGVWQPVRTSPQVVPSIMHFVDPGAQFADSATVENPVTMPPGRYRVVKQWGAANWSVPTSQTRPPLTLHAYVDVLPGPGGGPAPNRCGEPDDAAAASGTLDRATAAHDQQLTLTVANTGPVCLEGSDIRYRIDRYLPDGSTEAVLPRVAYQPDRSVVLQPGGSRQVTVAVENFVVMPTGRYRVSYDLWVPPVDDRVVVRTVQADFHVVGG